MNIKNFSANLNKKLIFKQNSLTNITENISFFGRKTVLFTGGSSFKEKGHLKTVEEEFLKYKIDYKVFTISKEPDVSIIDLITAEVKLFNPNSIVAIGGGSVIDAAKAVSAMYNEIGSVIDFLEGIGTKKPSGKKLPLIAVPTTAGTGSEATYNAVIKGSKNTAFKKSLRHENYIADIVIIDPILYMDCPVCVAASSGLDAISQLIESYISTKSFFFTDTLILSAVEGIIEAFPIITSEADDKISKAQYIEAWKKMAYGAYISGLSLSNAGLCVIHGIAGTIGGFFDAPHGALCGTILAESLKITIAKLEKVDAESPYLLKLSNLGYIASKSDDMLPKEARTRLVQIIENLTYRLKIPTLSEYGIKKKDLQKIADNSSNKNNPVELTTKEIMSILENRF